MRTCPRCLEDGRQHQSWAVGSRGPRPKSDKWPKVGQQAVRPGQSAAGISKVSLECPTSSIRQSPSRQSFRRSHRRGVSLEAALSALGEGSPLAKLLVEAFRNAHSKAKILLLEDQISKNFIERARKRVSRVKAVIFRALEQKVVFEKEVQEGEARGIAFPGHRRCCLVSHRVATQNRRFDTRTRFSEGGHPESAPRSVDGRWSANCGVNFSNPMSSVQDIEGWLSNTNCELRNALELRDSATVARVGALVAQGSVQLASLVQGRQPILL